MAINEVGQLISTIGFPIAMCIIMGFFIKYTTDIHREDLRLQQENHKETASRLANSIDENTSVLEELSAKVDMSLMGVNDDGK